MSNKTARDKLSGHGRVICEECERVIVTCKCFKCSGNILYDVCDVCEQIVKQRKEEINV